MPMTVYDGMRQSDIAIEVMFVIKVGEISGKFSNAAATSLLPAYPLISAEVEYVPSKSVFGSKEYV